MTPLVWHDNALRPAWQQMAIDRTLADYATQHGTWLCRLYRWERDSVSFGANEAARRTWDRERLERLQVPCVRRPTGGRAVWHDAADLTYATTAPLAVFGSLPLAYRLIHEQLARALGRLNLAATLAPGGSRPTLAPGACFDLAVGGEVLVGERKTIGSAQALIGNAVLQHGAIARAGRGAALARFRLDSAPVDPGISGSPLPAAERVANAIVTTWREEGGALAPTDLIEQAIRDSTLLRDRYQDPDWTWRR